MRNTTLLAKGNPIVPLVNARILARLIPDARLHVLRRAAHLFLLERPAEAARLGAAFLAEGRRSPWQSAGMGAERLVGHDGSQDGRYHAGG